MTVGERREHAILLESKHSDHSALKAFNAASCSTAYTRRLSGPELSLCAEKCIHLLRAMPPRGCTSTTPTAAAVHHERQKCQNGLGRGPLGISCG